MNPAEAIEKAYAFPGRPRQRRHDPRGYSDYRDIKPWLRDEFDYRCAYCLVRERWYPNGSESFSADHFLPRTFYPGKVRVYSNLVYACLRCNSYKSDHEGVLNPDREIFADHLYLDEGGVFQAKTVAGNIHIAILRLNREPIVSDRQRRINSLRELCDNERFLQDLLGYPNDLPNLKTLRPPLGNSRPEGVLGCAYERQQSGHLPAVY